MRYITVFDKDHILVASLVVDGLISEDSIVNNGYNYEYSKIEPMFFKTDDNVIKVITNKEAFKKNT